MHACRYVASARCRPLLIKGWNRRSIAPRALYRTILSQSVILMLSQLGNQFQPLWGFRVPTQSIVIQRIKSQRLARLILALLANGFEQTFFGHVKQSNCVRLVSL